MRICAVALGWLAIAQDAPQPERKAPPAATRYAAAISKVQPEYTPEARAAGLQGSVILYAEVSPAGEVQNAEVIQGLGLGLDEKAIEAVRQWRFQPLMADGKPIRSAQSVEVRFLLSPAGSWRIARAGYRVTVPRGERVGQISRPFLNQYTSPEKQCLSERGTVIVEMQISKQGKPSQIRLVAEYGEGAGQAVTQVVPAWRFQPGLADGKVHEASGTLEMECRAAGAFGDHGEDIDLAQVLQVGKGASPPKVLYKVDPDYSEEARKARYMGTVVFSLVVDASGHATHIRVVRSLGPGLDQKAMEAITRWRFTPGMRDGAPVATWANIEVNFRLL